MIVYDLRADADSIARMQTATTKAIRPWRVTKYGLFGTDEWWKQIEPLVRVGRGTIDERFFTGHNDFAMFRASLDSGVVELPCEGDPAAYVPGSNIALTFLENRHVFMDDNPDKPFVLKVEIDGA